MGQFLENCKKKFECNLDVKNQITKPCQNQIETSTRKTKNAIKKSMRYIVFKKALICPKLISSKLKIPRFHTKTNFKFNLKQNREKFTNQCRALIEAIKNLQLTSWPRILNFSIVSYHKTLNNFNVENSIFSHAILLYLNEKYAKKDDLYPKNDFLLRTKINEVLFYEASCLFARIYDMAVNKLV
jgi:hypothetical protein